ncbi:MAG: metallophosphoesterase [Verrucomicrobia bacterium]|nr:metallophosphoesterase [Verrucomicrobiota bacterium]
MKKEQAAGTISASPSKDSLYPCVEKGIWTPIPKAPPPGDLRLNLKSVDEEQSKRIKATNRLTFHAVGCSGCYEQYPNGPQPGPLVANAMGTQAATPTCYGGDPSAEPASFLFHLGDIVYKQGAENDAATASNDDGKDQGALYTTQFYNQYDSYEPEVFAIAGNHDCKFSKHSERSGIDHFLINFCDSSRRSFADKRGASKRQTMIQPYPYWTLETPAAYIVGLHTNDVNGGLLDDPEENEEPQYAWFVETLESIKKAEDGKALMLALHYPPYSGATNFSQRGDPNLGPTPRRNPGAGLLQPLAVILQHAFQQAGIYPDLVISAHAHLYQRITYTYTGGHQIPYLIAGSGGHWPVEKMGETCNKSLEVSPTPPFPVILPRGVLLPAGDSGIVNNFNDTQFGYVRITVDLGNAAIAGEFFTIDVTADAQPRLSDSFHLDLSSHQLR